MRPKIVILTLVVAFGVLGLVVVLKSVSRKAPDDRQGSMPESAAVASTQAGSTNVAVAVGSKNGTAVSEEVRAAVIEKEVSEIQDIVNNADGSNNVQIVNALLEKYSNPEMEVRKAVLDALRQLNDTNAVPGLEKIVDNAKDAREKVAILDTIEYINMPSVTQNVPSELTTNVSKYNSALAPVEHNPAFLKADKHPHVGR